MLRGILLSVLATFIVAPAGAGTMVRSGDRMTEWVDIDGNMVDLIEDGYQLVQHYFQLGNGTRTDRYFLQKGSALTRCTEITMWTKQQPDQYHALFGCTKLVRPYQEKR